MATRRPDGSALLVAGHGVAGAGAPDASAVHTLGQIGEALLATGDAWQIRRLTATAGERYAADRATLKRALDELAAEPVRVAIVVLLGCITDVGGAPALVTGSGAREYPEDATLPLAWIRERLAAARAERIVIVISGRGATSPTLWLEALATRKPAHLVAVDAPLHKHPLADALLTGLCGDAVDPRTGTVTMASLSRHLAQTTAIVQPSSVHETVAQPPPLAGLWDVRRSQLSQRAGRGSRTSVASDGGPEELLGVVLPGRFRVDQLVARGTFGSVYRARQLAVERDVAVKVLHADIDPSSEDGRLFVHEIRSVGRIDHANVVRIYQADIAQDGRLFFAMELLDGSDLQRLGADGPLPVARAVELVRQLLAGLGAAHDAGLVHADVKPANAISVASAGGDRVVLVDFGLARLRAPDRPAESAGGTPAYMAPEQLHEGRVDARSDLYSAALVLVYLLTGWRRPNAMTLAPPLDGIEPELREVLVRALDNDPAKRFQTARELAAALIGTTATPLPAAPPAPNLPFRHLAPLTESDRGRLHGRESDLAVLTEHALYRRSVIYTAPSGTGKTSMLRAGLLPRLEALGIQAVYVRCRGDLATTLATAILPRTAPAIVAPASEAATQRSDRDGDDAAIAPTERTLVPAPPPVSAQLAMGGVEVAPVGGMIDVVLLESTSVRPGVLAGDPATVKRPKILASGTGPSLPHVTDDDPPALAAPPSIADAIAAWHKQRGGKLVIILDQLEAVLADADFVPAVLAFDRWPPSADVTVVLSIREDYLARLVARTQELEPNMPIVRLPPLSPDGARSAIVSPLAESRLAIEPELLTELLGDLQRAAAAIGPEMGWGAARAVFPPHLQLACSVLYEALGPGEATLTLAHYKKLGGFDTIVGEHLERVIDTELADGRDHVARDLFVALVTTHHERAMRPESELLAMVGDQHGRDEVLAVLEILRSRGLLVRVRADGNEAGWELVHDSLIPRVRAWIDRRDLARRRAIELVRYHVRRSRPHRPSLLGRAELRELRAHESAIAELDREWDERATHEIGAWTPSRLVARSKQVLRHQILLFGSILVLALGVAGLALYRSYTEERRARREESLRDRDLGRFTLALESFDWDPASQRVVPASLRDPAQLAWELRAPDERDPQEPGKPFDDSWLVRGDPQLLGSAIVEHVEAHGGRAYLVVARHGCTPVTIPLRQLPGYAARGRAEPTLHVPVASCRATAAGMVPIPAGPFVAGGVGDPPSQTLLKYSHAERRVDLPAYAMDRTEVTNAAFAVFATEVTGVEHPAYSTTAPNLHDLDAPSAPVTGIDWFEARAYCRFLGKELPTADQWQKALRGGETLPDGRPNPVPRRSVPWGEPLEPVRAHIASDTAHTVTADPGDVSPYGVLDLAGNVSEWTTDLANPHMRTMRGGNYLEVHDAAELIDFDAIINPRAEHSRSYALGMRCVSVE